MDPPWVRSSESVRQRFPIFELCCPLCSPASLPCALMDEEEAAEDPIIMMPGPKLVTSSVRDTCNGMEPWVKSSESA